MKQFDYREVITFSPISLSVSFPLCYTHRPNSAQHASSLHCNEYQSEGLKMRSCYCRSTVCTNREGRCTRLQRGDRIMMSSGNISASFLTLKSSFPAQLTTETNTGHYCDTTAILLFCVLNLLSLLVFELLTHIKMPLMSTGLAAI